jgi:hypothetical protein
VEKIPKSLPIGAHLIGVRRFYWHHGIYLGGGNVAHYSGFCSSLKPGPIEVIDLESFSSSRPVWIYPELHGYSSNEIVKRARSRIGERQYKLFSNNCEHFCYWCISGKNYSSQVDAYFQNPFVLFFLMLKNQIFAQCRRQTEGSLDCLEIKGR